MSQRLTIVMYHYVRELEATRFPRIKGRRLSEFREQLGYLRRHYRFVTVEECLDALQNGTALPPRAVLLTFDDGYADHYMNVFPLLDEMGVQGVFSPVVQTVEEHVVLDVNKVHFVLASVENLGLLMDDVYGCLDRYRERWGLDSNEAYHSRLAVASRFDPAEVIFIKRLLQVELPPEARRVIADHLFRKYVTSDEVAFAQELYLNRAQLACMARHGMCVGVHGREHLWLDSLAPDEQEHQIAAGVAFLRSLGFSAGPWVMCYPYGAHNASLLDIVRRQGCGLGLGTQVALADLTRDDPLALPRLDTNDLPCDGDAAPNAWTTAAGEASL
ncbi:MAG: polysaccharide deacetylase family protein [Armatimonadetes bacterium]|nr:polysaccharide deacetylase family protein [Armatimonadota bacterium]